MFGLAFGGPKPWFGKSYKETSFSSNYNLRLSKSEAEELWKRNGSARGWVDIRETKYSTRSRT